MFVTLPPDRARRSTAVALVVAVTTLSASCTSGVGSSPSAARASSAGTVGTPSGAGTSASTSQPTSAPTTAAPPAAPPREEPTPEECAKAVVRGLSTAERAGQLLVVGLDANARRTSLDRLIRGRHLGGVILLGGWTSGRDDVRAATRHLSSLPDRPGGAPGLLLAADQEGGRVQQLRGDGFTRIPTALEQGTWSPAELRRRASRWADELRAAGINVNLAPVADTVPTSIGPANDPIGQWDRQFSSDPRVVARSVAAFIKGMHEGEVATATKHFPGIGRIRGNTDLTAEGIVDRTTSRTDPFLRPFAGGVAAGTDLVMVGSAIYSRIDPGVQALFSRRIVTDLLRKRLGYQGVVITDDVGAAKSVAATPVGQRATRFVGAGGDIVLTARPDTVPAMHRALTARMGADRDFTAKVTAAATRVVALKAELGLVDCD